MFRLPKKLLITVSINLFFFVCVAADSVKDYKISVSVDPQALSAEGVETIEFIPAADTDTMPLHLYWNAYENGSLFRKDAPENVFKGLPDASSAAVSVDFVYVDGKTVSGACGGDPTVYEIKYPFKNGRRYHVKIGFSLKIPDKRLFRFGYDSADGVYWFSQWFPKPGVLNPDGTWDCRPFSYYREFYADFSSYSLTVDVPGGYSIVSNLHGEEDGVFRGDRISDVVFGVSKNLVTHAGEDGPVKMSLVTYRDLPETVVRHVLERAAKGMERMNGWVGRYPYADFTIMDLASIGIQGEGMEYPMLINIDARHSRVDTVIDHELAHQWFYGVIGFNETDEGWLDEGFASYYEMRLADDDPPRNIMGIVYTPGDIKYVIAANGWDETGDVFVAPGEDDVPEHSKLLAYYMKFPVILRIIESRCGSAAMDAIFSRMYRDFAYRHPNTSQITALFGEMLTDGDFTDMMTMISGNGDTSFAVALNSHAVSVVKGGERKAGVDVLLREKGRAPYKTDDAGAEIKSENPLLSVHALSLDETPGDNFAARGRAALPLAVYMFAMLLAAFAIRLFKTRGPLNEVFWNLLAFFPVYLYIVLISAGMPLFDGAVAGFSPVVLLISRIGAAPPLFPIIVAFAAFTAKVTFRSISLYKLPGVQYSFFRLFFVDIINAFLLPLLVLIMVSVSSASILLMFAFVFMMSMAEPMKISALGPGRKDIPMKEVLPLSFVLTLVYFAVLLLFLMSALPFMIFSPYFIIAALILLSCAEYLYRRSYVIMYAYLGKKVLNGR